MKPLSTSLAILMFTLAPLAAGCVAESGDSSAEGEDTNEASEAQINTGGGPHSTRDDLEDDGYTCGIVGTFPGIQGVMICVKQGSPTYYCSPNGTNCHTQSARIIGVPLEGTVAITAAPVTP